MKFFYSKMKFVDEKLIYFDMYNWTNDLPENCNSRQDFLDILDYFNFSFNTLHQKTKILEIGTYTGIC